MPTISYECQFCQLIMISIGLFPCHLLIATTTQQVDGSTLMLVFNDTALKQLNSYNNFNIFIFIVSWLIVIYFFFDINLVSFYTWCSWFQQPSNHVYFAKNTSALIFPSSSSSSSSCWGQAASTISCQPLISVVEK